MSSSNSIESNFLNFLKWIFLVPCRLRYATRILFVVLLPYSAYRIPIARASFTNDFRAFLHNRYGVALVNMLERAELGADASFGGRLFTSDASDGGSSSRPLNNEPVIIVHGITNKISRFQGTVEALKRHGYDYPAEIYGTTWGDGGVTPAGIVEMKCDYVKHVRSMIIAVREYTGKKVDVIAYSMGSPIARKAILGGNCIDTREVLGPPLTEHVDTFLSVAGANYGTALCFIAIPIGTCNRRNGLHCNSEFLADINSPTTRRYEGANIFSIFSTGDEKIGFRACNRLTSPIVGENGYVKKNGLSHDDVLDKTLDMQVNFIRKHRPR